MPVGLPTKTTYANGDVFSASDINDTNGTLNLVGQTNNFYAGKNKIINGDFEVWQRGSTFTNATVNTYTADRWFFGGSGSNTGSISRQTFTPGTAPVSGYEGEFFFRFNQTTTAISPTVTQRIEDVRIFAGQTVRVSFWAKTASSMNGLRSITFNQNFGSGGSGTVTTTVNAAVATTTAWTRFSYSVAVPSITGKTLGANSYLELSFNTAEFVAVTLDLWGVMVEAGSNVTAFQTATGTIQGELAACQRYYFRISGNASAVNTAIGWLNPYSTTQAVGQIKNPITMRTIPYSIEFSTLVAAAPGVASAAISTLTFNTASTGPDITSILITTASGLVAYRMCDLLTSTSAGYLGISAEL
jgi:hypothetical protein